jgi:ABC-type bacteriocin/lantibiotic exporter with double-glycine peptidase domain
MKSSGAMRIPTEIWRLLDQRQRRQFLLLQLLALFMAFSTLSGAAAVLPFFTVLSQPQSIHHNRILSWLYEFAQFHDERSFMIALGCGFVGVVLLANAINLLGTLAINRYTHTVARALYTTLFDEYLTWDAGRQARANSAVLASNILVEVARLTVGVLQHGLLLTTSLVTIVFLIASLVALNPLLAACALGGFGIGYLLIYTSARRKLLRNGALQRSFHAERSKIVNESLSALKEISILHAEEFFKSRFAHSCDAIARAALSTQAVAQSPRYGLECLTAAGLVAAALYLSASGGAAAPWLAQLTFVGFAAYRLLPALQQVFTATVTIRADSPALNQIVADLARARARRDATPAAGNPQAWMGRPQQAIALRELSFTYENSSVPAVDGVTLRIPAGAVIGLIGPNGSGKTTLVDLILGLLAPQSGELQVDEITLDERNRRDWQSTVAYVPQQVVLLDATVTENIALGVAPQELDAEQLRRAARLARLDEFVLRLPRGYDEVLGERGARLSGGQRQRIGIARALYRNSSLLVMDEPTHALDESVEQELLAALETLRGRCTVILIAHRLDTLRNCDLIFEMRAGRVVSSGNYPQLTGLQPGEQRLNTR